MDRKAVAKAGYGGTNLAESTITSGLSVHEVPISAIRVALKPLGVPVQYCSDSHYLCYMVVHEEPRALLVLR